MCVRFGNGSSFCHFGAYVLIESVPSLFKFLERTNRLFTQGTERFRFNFVLCSDGNSIVPSTFACLDEIGKERLRIVHVSYHFFSRSIFWDGTVLFEPFYRLNATLQRFTFRNNTEGSGTIASNQETPISGPSSM